MKLISNFFIKKMISYNYMHESWNLQANAYGWNAKFEFAIFSMK